MRTAPRCALMGITATHRIHVLPTDTMARSGLAAESLLGPDRGITVAMATMDLGMVIAASMDIVADMDTAMVMAMAGVVIAAMSDEVDTAADTMAAMVTVGASMEAATAAIDNSAD